MKFLSLIRKSDNPHYTPVLVNPKVESGLEAPTHSSQSKSSSRYWHGWRFTVATGACLSFVVLWTNVGLLLVAQSKNASSDSIINIFEGSCSKRARTITLYHLAINVLSTLLLGASASCVQVLAAPTREEIDFWHSHGAWLNIGVLSWRNLKRISKWRVGLMLLLALNSIPLHLVYNSIIFGTQNNSQFVAILVTQDFVTGGTFQPTASIMPTCNHTSPWPAPSNDNGLLEADPCVRKNYEGQAPNATQLQQLQRNITSLERLENTDCVNTFQTPYEPVYRGVVLVSNVTSTTDSVLQFLDTNITTGKANGWWMCENDWAQSLSSHETEYVYGDVNGDGGDSVTTNAPSTSCDPTSLASNATGWQMFDPSAANPSTLLDIDYCLAERSQFQECTIGFSKPLMLVVIVFNAVKVLCFVLALTVCTSPLITIGDAIASFLEHPDPTTIGFGTHPVKNLRDYQAWKTLRHAKPGTHMIAPPPPVPYRWETPKRRLWHEAVSVPRKLWTFGLGFFFLIFPAVLAASGDPNKGARDPATFGSIDSSYMLHASLRQSLTSDILLANAPQLAMSVMYGIWNSYLTSMIQSAEYLRFSTHRRTLRVSVPVGDQRSTFWLNIPYRFAVPVMVAMALMHWLISESIFLARTYVWDYNYAIDDQYSISGTGWSSFALLFTILTGLSLILALLFLGMKKLPMNMPLAGSNSAAISAACHRQEIEASDIVRRPLKYGVLPAADAEGRRRVGFSAEEVEPLVSGEIYV